jgi:hypothetical protein
MLYSSIFQYESSRICTIKSVDGTNISSFCVHECEGKAHASVECRTRMYNVNLSNRRTLGFISVIKLRFEPDGLSTPSIYLYGSLGWCNSDVGFDDSIGLVSQGGIMYAQSMTHLLLFQSCNNLKTCLFET